MAREYASNVDVELQRPTANPTNPLGRSNPRAMSMPVLQDPQSPPMLPPVLRSGVQSVDELAIHYLSSGLAADAARRAGRSVEAFDVVLTSPCVQPSGLAPRCRSSIPPLTPACLPPARAVTTDGRSISLEVGDHGLSLRDPAGALLKVIAIEHMTGWGAKPDGTFVIITSADLESFKRMTLRTDDGAAIDAALKRVASARAEARLPSEEPDSLQPNPDSEPTLTP